MTEFDVAAVDLSGILNKTAEEKAKQLPDPKTFHLLCVVPEAMEEYADSEVGLVKADKNALRRGADPSAVCREAWPRCLQRYDPLPQRRILQGR